RAAVLARREGALLDRALRRLALRALQEELDLLAAAELAVRVGVAGHLNPPFPSNPSAPRRTAAVVRDRRDVGDLVDLEPGRGERADRRLAPGARALHEHVHPLHAVLHRAPGRRFGRELRGERRRFARTLETDVSARGP